MVLVKESVISVHSNELRKLIGQTEKVEGAIYVLEKLVIDTEAYRFASPLVLSVLTAFLRDVSVKNPSIEVYTKLPANNDVRNYMTRVKFYKLNNFPVEYPYQEHDSSGRFIEIKCFNEGNQDSVVEELTQIVISAGLAPGLQRALAFCFGEIIDNCCCHADSHVDGIVSAQSFSDRIEVAIVDRGIGVAESLRAVESMREMSSTELLQHSIKEGVTSKKNHPIQGHQGFGLYSVNQIAQMNGGSLTLHTYDACLETSDGDTVVCDAPRWKGTIIHLTLKKNISSEDWELIWDEVFRIRGFEEPYLRHLDEDIF